MEQRRKLRAQVESQKQSIMAKFTQMQKQGSGKISPQDLGNLMNVSNTQAGAFTVEQTTATASAQPAGPWKAKTNAAKPGGKQGSALQKDAAAAEMLGKEKIGMLRKKQNEELLQILDDEQKLEAEREKQLAAATSDKERHRLENIFGLERAKSSQRIVGISE